MQHGFSESDLKSTRRSRAVNHPRMLAMFLARKHTGAALADIGRHFGRRSHSTVLAAEKTVRQWMTSSQVLSSQMQRGSRPGDSPCRGCLASG